MTTVSGAGGVSCHSDAGGILYAGKTEDSSFLGMTKVRNDKKVEVYMHVGDTRSVRSLPFVWLAVVGLIVSLIGPLSPAANAQNPDCQPLDTGTPVPEIADVPELPGFDVPDGAIEVTFGYIPVSIFAPVFVAYEKGYFAEQGLDVQLEVLPGGSDMVLLTSTGDMDMAIAGVGPAYWNAHSPVSYTHLRAHETDSYLVCRLLLEKKKKKKN